MLSLKKEKLHAKRLRARTAAGIFVWSCRHTMATVTCLKPSTQEHPKCVSCPHFPLWPSSPGPVTWSDPSLAWILHCRSPSNPSPGSQEPHRQCCLWNAGRTFTRLRSALHVHPDRILYLFVYLLTFYTFCRHQVKYTCSRLLSWICLSSPLYMPLVVLESLIHPPPSLHPMLMIVLILLELNIVFPIRGRQKNLLKKLQKKERVNGSQGRWWSWKKSDVCSPVDGAAPWLCCPEVPLMDSIFY